MKLRKCDFRIQGTSKRREVHSRAQFLTLIVKQYPPFLRKVGKKSLNEKRFPRLRWPTSLSFLAQRDELCLSRHINVLTPYLHAQGVFAVCMFHEKWTRAHNVIRVHIYSPYFFSPFPEVIKGFPLSVSTLVIRQLVRRDFFVFEEFMKYWTQLPLVRYDT